MTFWDEKKLEEKFLVSKIKNYFHSELMMHRDQVKSKRVQLYSKKKRE